MTFGVVHALLAAHETLLPVIVGLGSLFGSYGRIPYAVVMAGFVLATLPFVLVFAFLGRSLRPVLRDFLSP